MQVKFYFLMGLLIPDWTGTIVPAGAIILTGKLIPVWHGQVLKCPFESGTIVPSHRNLYSAVDLTTLKLHVWSLLLKSPTLMLRIYPQC